MVALLLAAAFATLPALDAAQQAGAAGREDVNFNFGWTHRYGLHPEPPLPP
eukprot:COSAG02_NODE_611_length_19555_cov_34.449270_15_plen_51_part_00